MTKFEIPMEERIRPKTLFMPLFGCVVPAVLLSKGKISREISAISQCYVGIDSAMFQIALLLLQAVPMSISDDLHDIKILVPKGMSKLAQQLCNNSSLLKGTHFVTMPSDILLSNEVPMIMEELGTDFSTKLTGYKHLAPSDIICPDHNTRSSLEAWLIENKINRYVNLHNMPDYIPKNAKFA
jgi:hypothetical protein